MTDKETTHDTPKTHHAVIPKTRAWFFTWNNYKEEDIQYLLGKFKNEQYLFGEEIGKEKGTPHLQGTVRFKNARSEKSVWKLLKNNHAKPCRNWIASLTYCSKDGRTFTNIENKKTRKERLLGQYKTVKWKKWQQEVIDICETKPDNRTINWFWEEDGNVGKSFLAKYLVLKYNAIISEGKKDNVFNQIKVWLDNNRQDIDPTLVLLDVPRNCVGYINYGLLEQIKNGMIYSGKYEGGVCLFESPHIIIFANVEPDIEQMSKDRWRIKKIDN